MFYSIEQMFKDPKFITLLPLLVRGEEINPMEESVVLPNKFCADDLPKSISTYRAERILDPAIERGMITKSIHQNKIFYTSTNSFVQQLYLFIDRNNKHAYEMRLKLGLATQRIVRTPRKAIEAEILYEIEHNIEDMEQLHEDISKFPALSKNLPGIPYCLLYIMVKERCGMRISDIYGELKKLSKEYSDGQIKSGTLIINEIDQACRQSRIFKKMIKVNCKGVFSLDPLKIPFATAYLETFDIIQKDSSK